MTLHEKEEVFLASLTAAAGPVGSDAARKLLVLAKDLGAELVPGSSSWSIRVPGAPGTPTESITLFLISARGTFWLRWLDRWVDAGVPPIVATEYQQKLVALLGKEVLGRQMHTEKAVGLRTIAKEFSAIEAAVRDAMSSIRAAGAGGTRS